MWRALPGGACLYSGLALSAPHVKRLHAGRARPRSGAWRRASPPLGGAMQHPPPWEVLHGDGGAMLDRERAAAVDVRRMLGR